MLWRRDSKVLLSTHRLYPAIFPTKTPSMQHVGIKYGMYGHAVTEHYSVANSKEACCKDE
jgi:hypothetical protein